MAYNCIHFSEHMKQIKMLLLSMSFGNTLLIAMFCECVCFLYSEKINKTDMLPFRNCTNESYGIGCEMTAWIQRIASSLCFEGNNVKSVCFLWRLSHSLRSTLDSFILLSNISCNENLQIRQTGLLQSSHSKRRRALWNCRWLPFLRKQFPPNHPPSQKEANI